MPWYLYLAFKQLFPTGKRFSFFGTMSIIGVMLGVMVLLVVQTVMNGFTHTIHEKIRGVSGDIVFQSENIMYDWQETIERIEAKDYVQAAAPLAYGNVMLQHNDHPAFPMIHGLDVVKSVKVIPFEDFLIAGILEDLDDDTIILSSGMARSIGASMGSKVSVYTPLMLERMRQDEILLPQDLEVVGIFESGYTEFDTNFVFVTLRNMQELYGLGRGIHGINIKLNDGFDLQDATTDLNLTIGNTKLRAINWMEMKEDLMFALKVEKTMMFFIILFVILVASFSIASSLMTSVVRKTREIGLLAALGGRRSRISMIFTFQGFLIGAVGSILGVIGGILAIEYRNNIVDIIARLLNKEDFIGQMYFLSEVPAHYLLSDFIAIIFSALVIATFAGFIPAMRAARLKPSDALRHE